MRSRAGPTPGSLSPPQLPDTGGILFSYVYPGRLLGRLERTFLSTVAPVW